MDLLTERYKDKIKGVISCYDRVIIYGTLIGWHYPKAMTDFLYQQNVRIFDYAQWAQPFNDQIRQNTEQIAKKNNIQIEFIRKSNIRKENIIKKILQQRGSHSGLVHIISVMEKCQTYKPWHDKLTHQTYLKSAEGKCLHYYFYFIDKKLGLGYLRVPTWAPFGLQFYFNGHGLLASKLSQAGIKYKTLDNAFIEIADFQQAQILSDNLNIQQLHKILDDYAQQFCPVIKDLKFNYHWSVSQAEYATDIIFKNQADLQNIYDDLVRTAIHTVKPDNIATFLGKKLDPRYQDEVGNNFNTRIEGTRIKHQMGTTSIKMYDKFKFILRLETSSNDISFFKHYRSVEQKDGSIIKKNAAMKKYIYSLPDLATILSDSNARYLAFISAIADKTVQINNLNKVSKSVSYNDRPYKGFNFFSDDDQNIFRAVARGEFNISGFQNKNLKQFIAGKTNSQISRILKRLKIHGLIKKIAKTYKYYLTKFGKTVITLGLKLTQLYIMPQLQ